MHSLLGSIDQVLNDLDIPEEEEPCRKRVSKDKLKMSLYSAKTTFEQSRQLYAINEMIAC
jgi:hypothetical protein